MRPKAPVQLLVSGAKTSEQLRGALTAPTTRIERARHRDPRHHRVSAILPVLDAEQQHGHRSLPVREIMHFHRCFVMNSAASRSV